MDHCTSSRRCRTGNGTCVAIQAAAATGPTAAGRHAAAAARWIPTWLAAPCSSGRRLAPKPATRRACAAPCAAGALSCIVQTQMPFRCVVLSAHHLACGHPFIPLVLLWSRLHGVSVWMCQSAVRSVMFWQEQELVDVRPQSMLMHLQSPDGGAGHAVPDGCRPGGGLGRLHVSSFTSPPFSSLYDMCI